MNARVAAVGCLILSACGGGTPANTIPGDRGPALTVEVAESSLAIDRQHKGSLYARAGLADYWVLNLVDRVLEVYREPAPDSAAVFGWRYARLDVFDGAARVTPLAAPGSSIAVSLLLP